MARLQEPVTSRKSFPGRRFSIGAGLGLGLGLFCLGPAVPAQLQPRDFRSIHQIEAEAHRDLVVQPVPGRERLLPLPPAATSGLTHTVFGFFPYWTPGYSQIRFQDLTHLAYFSAETNESGQLVNLRGWPNGPLIETAHRNGVRVVLVCTLMNSTQIQSLLSSATARRTLIDNLRDQVVLGGADGVNIDFEPFPASQKANMVTFMRELAAVIRGAVPGAHISVDTPAVDWSNGWDFPALADICDALMIMGYDYHYAGSANAGPVAQLDSGTLWGSISVRKTVTDYLAKIGTSRSNRILLGVPYYGRDWPTESESLNARTLGSATSRSYLEASAGAALYGRRWESSSATPWYAYRTTTTRQVWYDDPESLSRKYDLVYLHNLQGIGIWALNHDYGSPDLWNLLERRFTPPEAPDILAPALFFDTAGLPVALRERGSVPAEDFELAVGSTPDGQELRGFSSVGLRRQILLRGLSLESGKTYYVRARSLGAGRRAGNPGPSVAIRIDTTPAPEQRFVTRWISSVELYTGLAMVNSAPQTRAVLFRGHSAAGDKVASASWVLAPGQQLASLLSQPDLLGSGTPGPEGWLEISAPADGWPALFLVGDNLGSRSLEGGRFAAAAAAQILPELDGGQALVSLANPAPVAAQLQLSLLLSNGGTLVRKLSLNPGALLTARVSELLPEYRRAAGAEQGNPAAYGLSDYLRVDADRPVLCSSILQRGQDTAEIPGLDAARPVRSGSFAYAPLGGGYRSQALLVNPAPESQTVELRMVESPPGRWVPLELPAAAALTADLALLLKGSDTDVGGAVELRVTRGSGILGALWIRSGDFRVMTSMPLGAGVAADYVFPQLAQAQGYWTGLSLANPGLSAAEVAVSVFDAAGALVGSAPVRLGPGETRVGLVYEWIRGSLGMSSGRVEVHASIPVLAAEIFGSESLAFIAAVPGR